MILDVHCHVVPPEISANPAGFGRRDRHFGRLTETKGARFPTGDELLRDMGASGIDMAVAFGFGFSDLEICRMQNDYVLSLAKENPGKIAAMAVINPDVPGALREAERCLAQGACGFGELFPAGHGFSLMGEEMSRLCGLAREAKVPLQIHVNEQIGHIYPGKDGAGAEEAYEFSVKNPENTVIFAHLGGGLPFYGAMPEVKALENTYYDTAAQPYLFKSVVYEGLNALGMIPKILLGSDYPLLSWQRYIRELGKSGLSEECLERILWSNAHGIFAKFFGFPSEGNLGPGANNLD